ncbi:YxeA family protein [Lactiplantibacillus modestisalitolerans]|uniref:YxeA family protein n=1 Tax=Lactiplantibacillus modestisalitolerans TaxID=1457219 RepID=A0ABV5WWR6_9LACO|nr:YxeA family protein [Lactiplantibacillus modestisalitolerans]
MKKGLLGLALVIVLIVGGLLASGTVTKNRGDEFSMALDNVNPLVPVTTVYGKTNQAVSYHQGQMGEDVYEYRINTVDAKGNRRWLTFDADHRLKLNHYLKIETKGQNVNSWAAVPVTQLPSQVNQVIALAPTN